jgi:hypothetical protein
MKSTKRLKAMGIMLLYQLLTNLIGPRTNGEIQVTLTMVMAIIMNSKKGPLGGPANQILYL